MVRYVILNAASRPLREASCYTELIWLAFNSGISGPFIFAGIVGVPDNVSLASGGFTYYDVASDVQDWVISEANLSAIQCMFACELLNSNQSKWTCTV